MLHFFRRRNRHPALEHKARKASSSTAQWRGFFWSLTLQLLSLNHKGILARPANHLQCSYAFETKTLLLFFSFLPFYQGVQHWVLLAEWQTACFDEELKKIFSAILMINVLIFLDMVWFGFWYSPTTTMTTHLRSFLRRLCHIEVCVAVQRLSLHLQ